MRRHPSWALAASVALLAVGAALYAHGTSEADAAADELADARAANEAAVEAGEAVELEDGVIDRNLGEAEVKATTLADDVADLQAASTLRVTAVGRLADLQQQALDALRANDGPGYNATVDQLDAQEEVVIDSRGAMEDALGPVLELLGRLRHDLEEAVAVPED